MLDDKKNIAIVGMGTSKTAELLETLCKDTCRVVIVGDAMPEQLPVLPNVEFSYCKTLEDLPKNAKYDCYVGNDDAFLKGARIHAADNNLVKLSEITVAEPVIVEPRNRKERRTEAAKKRKKMLYL